MLMLVLAFALQAVPPGEDPVDPYPQSNANAGAAPFKGTAMLKAFHGRAGIERIADDLVDRIVVDRVSAISSQGRTRCGSGGCRRSSSATS